jgi:hypothetical protein
MEKTFEVINNLVTDGIIDSYALGGAMAAIRYVEPFQTDDVDVFISISVDSSDLMPLKAVYEYLRNKGYFPKDVFVEIEGWDVQFLPVFDELIEEAVDSADTADLNGVFVRVMKPEYLVAIMLKTGRLKDFARAKMFFDQERIDADKLYALVGKFELEEKWRKYQQSL